MLTARVSPDRQPEGVITAAVVDSWDSSVRGGAPGCRRRATGSAEMEPPEGPEWKEGQISIQIDGRLDIVYVWIVKDRLVMWTG
jgi:hypothetical protein